MMENASVTNKTDTIKNKVHKLNTVGRKVPSATARMNPAIAELIMGGGEDFYHFLKYLNLSSESQIMVLSQRHHYYFEYRDLLDVKVLINVVKLNQIRNLASFLNSLFRVLPPDANFIGCFTDNKSTNGSKFQFYPPSKVFNKVINFLDSKTERDLGKKDVLKHLETHGFRVAEMAEINDLIYFLAKSGKEK
jgi:hypothetical protein